MTATDNILVTEVHIKILDGGCNRLLLSLHLKDEPNNTIYCGANSRTIFWTAGRKDFPTETFTPRGGFRSLQLGYLDSRIGVTHTLLF